MSIWNESLYTTFYVALTESVREVDGVKIVNFDLPLPELPLSPEQMFTLIEVAPDKQMSAALIQLHSVATFFGFTFAPSKFSG